MEMRKVLLKTMSIITTFVLAISIVLFAIPTQEVLAAKKNKEDYRMSQDAKDLIKACKNYWQDWGYEKAYSVELNNQGEMRPDRSFCYYIDTDNKAYGDNLKGTSKHVAVTESKYNFYNCKTVKSATSRNVEAVMKGKNEPPSAASHYFKIDNAVHAGSKLYDLIIVEGVLGNKMEMYLHYNPEKKGFHVGGGTDYFDNGQSGHSSLFFKVWVAEHTSDYTIGKFVNWTGLIAWDDMDAGEQIEIFTPTMHKYSSSNSSANAYVVGEETYFKEVGINTDRKPLGTRYLFGSYCDNDNTYANKNKAGGRWTMKGLDYYANWCLFAKVNIPTSGLIISYNATQKLNGGLASDAVNGFWETYSVRCIDKDKSSGKVLGEQSSGDIYYVNDFVSGSDWGTSSPYSGYTYDSCTSIKVSGIGSNDIVYRYFKQGPTGTPTPTPTSTPTPTPTPTGPTPTPEPVRTEEEIRSSDDYYYYVYYYSNGGSGSVSRQSARYAHVVKTTTIVKEDGVEVSRSTSSDWTYYTPSVTLRSNTFSPPYGYSKASGWSTSSGYYPSRGYWTNGESPSPVNGLSYNEGRSVTLNGNLYLYARWMPNQHQVTYHRNHTAGTVYGSPNPATVYYNQEINVGTDKYYARRTGWSFMGWHSNKNNHSVFSPVVILDTDSDQTLYAIYKRSLNLILAADALENKSEYSFPMSIYTHDSAFEYNSSSFKNATTRTKGTYTLTFKNNDGSHNIGLGEQYDSKGRVISTDLTGGTTITATRWFNGWYPDERSGYQADTESTKVGTSGTSVTVTPKEYTTHDYNVAGNTDNYNRTYSNDTITLYPIYDKTYVKLPDSRRNEDKGDNALHGGDEKDGDEEDLFIGWFTKPQPDDGGTGDGGIYYGKAGDLVEIKGNVTLYPWFNIAPVIVRSVIGEDLNGITPDGVKKGFYEGQPVSYQQLMSLINASDEDNPAEVGPEGLVTYNGPKVWATLLRLNLVSFLHDTYPDMTAAELDKYEQMANYDCFVPKLMSIEYKRDGKDPNGFDVSDGVSQTQTINGDESAMLLTDQENVGHVVLHYQVTDNGTFANGVQILTGRVSPGGKVYTIDSPITVEFYLDTVINFNNLPRIETRSVPLYSVDDNINSGNITKILLDYQNATDHEDDNDYKPWWYKAETGNNLDNSLNIVRVYDIKFNLGYQNEHPEECEEVANIDNIIDLFKLKDEGRVVFQHITNFMVEIDCVDQWGKHASGYYGNDHGIDGSYDETSKKPDGSVDPIGMRPEERSFVVTMFNNWNDYDLLKSNTVVSERMRYIDEFYSTFLSGNSYWGEMAYGKLKLQEVFNNYTESTPNATYRGAFGDRNISIEVNDYTQ